MVEPVDDAYRGVPEGEPASRLLVTVLASRTLPLIRYELTDRVRLSAASCGCGLPFRQLASIEGRTDDLLEVAGLHAPQVSLHPVLFHRVLEPLRVHGWQVRQELGGLRVLLAQAPRDLRDEEVAGPLSQALAAAGVRPLEIVIERVDQIPPGAGGKRPMVVRAARSS